MDMIRRARDEMRRNMNPYRKEELSDWFKIKKKHPSAFMRSRTTPKGVTRLAIWGSGKMRTVVPVSFLRYKKNPSDEEYTIRVTSLLSYYSPLRSLTSQKYGELISSLESILSEAHYDGNMEQINKIDRLIDTIRDKYHNEHKYKRNPEAAGGLLVSTRDNTQYPFNAAADAAYYKNPNPKAIYPLLAALFGLALLKVASMTTRQDDLVVDESEVMCSCQAHVTMHRKGDHG